MSLEQEYKYKVSDGIRYTQNEETKVLALLRDVRANVSLLRPDIADQRLDAILEVVEKGEWILQNLNVTNEKALDSIKQVELNYKIDLSQAKNMITQYRHDSEGGCQSCFSRKIYHPLPGESFTYCSKRENEDFAINNWSLNNSHSPNIKEFSKTGCEDRKPIHKRKLEEVLEGQN